MKDLGMMHYLLGMEVWQSTNGIFLGQGKYAIEILKRFGMMECKAITSGKLDISDQDTKNFGHHSSFQGINDQN